jgi:HK97 family phage major capsid protein
MTKREEMLRRAEQIALRGSQTAADKIEFDNIIRQVDQMDDGHVPALGGFAARHLDCPEARAFEKYVRYGIPSPELQARDLTTPTTGTGYQLIPQAFYPVLTEAKKAWGNIIEVLNLRETADGAPMKIAFSNDTGSLAQVLGEATPVSEEDPALSSALTLTDQCVTQLIKVSIPELQDSAFDIDQWVRNEFGKRYYRGLTSLITNGSPSGNIQSLLSAAGASVTSLYSNGIGYEDLVAMYGALDPAYIETACWMMKSTTRAFLLGVKDGFGRPLYTPNPTSGQLDRLLGLPVVLNQYMDGIAPSTDSPAVTNQPLLLGDFKQGYLLRLVKPGLAIARLNERFMDTLEVGFIGYFRAGGISTDAGTHPIVVLNQATSGDFPSSD